MIYILLVVLFFKGGLIQTTTLQAHSKADCEDAKPSIVMQYKQATYPNLRLDGKGKDLALIDVEVQCVLVDGSI